MDVCTYIVLALSILYILIVLKKWNKDNVKTFPPGPWAFPLIGNLLIMDLKKPHFTFLEVRQFVYPKYDMTVGIVLFLQKYLICITA